MATKFYYPAFLALVRRMDNFLSRHQKDMTDLCNITGTALTQLQDLRTALGVINGDSTNWPKYKYDR